ncbi:hypothetical protein ACFQ2K_47460 [Streptomyces sanglieri]|uniref:Uncharacterized protein n=1 Tax=Streptomyces sanglieri TaxID=193460 RepID=A0ABW2X8P1_9ACTN
MLAVVVSRTTYAYFAAKDGARVHADSSVVHTLLAAAVVPLTFALVVGAFHGWWWGGAVAVTSYALRLGVIVEYRTGRRELGSGKRTRTSPPAGCSTPPTPRPWPPCCWPGWCSR